MARESLSSLLISFMNLRRIFWAATLVVMLLRLRSDVVSDGAPRAVSEDVSEDEPSGPLPARVVGVGAEE